MQELNDQSPQLLLDGLQVEAAKKGINIITKTSNKAKNYKKMKINKKKLSE